jgi:DNA-binding response OmpR family regulator/predicted regulator of Ras-like GTPase activity (Roadblock/LC7/MglB family)
MSNQWHILIILDDEYLNRNIVNSLQIDGYLVKAVNTGTEAVHLLWAEEYHIVISDQKMPDADGFELLQWIRTYRPGTRMIMLGMPGSSVTRTQALESGVVSYLEKPLDLHILKEELRRLLQQTGFSASLDSFDLLDVTQIMNMSRKTIAMVVNTGLEEQGLLGFQAGELIWAEYGILRGEEAFFALAAHKNGTITHQPWNAQVKPNVTQPLSRLIFQALQYRSKYAAFHQLTGEQAQLVPSAISLASQLPDDDDRPFLFVEPVLADGRQQASSSHVYETPVPEQLVADEATEWWQEPASHEHPNKKFAAQPVTGDPASSVAQSVTNSLHVGNDLNGSDTGNTPVKAHKTPARQHVDLPSWLMDQPTQFEIPAMSPSSLTSTKQDSAASIIKASPAEWQSPVEQHSNVPLHRKGSPEWQEPENRGAGQQQSQTTARKTDDFAALASQQYNGPLLVKGSSTALTGEKSPGNGVSGTGANRTAFVTSSDSEHASKRNYPALIASLQTLGYSIAGFIATAVVSMDGQPVAQVAMDDLDITPMCEYCSNIMQSTIRGLDQAALGHFEDTIITSMTHFILLRLVGNKGDRFQVLITTRDADPVESLEIMANIEPAIESAL